MMKKIVKDCRRSSQYGFF